MHYEMAAHAASQITEDMADEVIDILGDNFDSMSVNGKRLDADGTASPITTAQAVSKIERLDFISDVKVRFIK